MKKKIPAWLVLTIICIVAAGLLAVTNLMTKNIIAENANRVKMETFGNLMPSAVKFTETDSGVTVGLDAEGNPVGYGLTATTQGFGGEVETTVAAAPDGTISGISVGGANFAETAGLGARAKEPEFQAQFAGKTAPVSLKKDGGEIDAISGATITSRAVVKGVNEAMEGIGAEAGFQVESLPEPESLSEGGAAGTADTDRFFRPRPAADGTGAKPESGEQEGTAAKAPDPDRFFRNRPEFIPEETASSSAEPASAASDERFYRERPGTGDVNETAEAAAPETETASAEQETATGAKEPAEAPSGDRFFRERPAAGDSDEAVRETASAETEAPSGDRFFRERPGTGDVNETAETAAPETETASAEQEPATGAQEPAEAPSGDRFFRERPGTGDVNETAAPETEAAPAEQETASETEEPAETEAPSGNRFFRERPGTGDVNETDEAAAPETETAPAEQETASETEEPAETSGPSEDRFFRNRP